MPGLPEPGAEWAGFRIEEHIGAGGSGWVFVAWDPGVGRRVAIEVRPPDAGAAERDRFVRDAQVAAGLDHPRIVPIYDVDEHEGTPYVITRYVEGGDLGEEISRGVLTVDRVRSVLGQIAGALDRAHLEGLVHGTVNPDNILCSPGADEVYLTGFGSTLDPGGDATEVLHHAAPEQLIGDEVGPASDVYALGCTLFECLTGRVPFPADTAAGVVDHHLNRPPPKITDLRPDLSSDLDDIVERAMAKDPSDRFPTARHLAEAVVLARAAAVGPGHPTAAQTVVEAPGGPVAAPTGGGRSVFDDPAASLPWADSSGVEPDPTVVVGRVGDADRTADGVIVGGDDDGLVDGALFGIYEDDESRSRVPYVVGGALVLVALIVGVLVWRAVNTDAELGPDTASTSTTVPEETTRSEPTVDALRALVPAGVETCVAPESDAEPPQDGSGRVVLQCPLADVPESLSLELFASDAARDAAFDDAAARLEISGRDDAECALGRLGRHAYRSDGHGGSVACQSVGGRVDFYWTRDDAPVLLHASGGGRFEPYVAAWNELAGRTDAAFPLPEEQQLLDALPDDLTEVCTRDLTLALEAEGVLAVVCRPEGVAAETVSWVRFGSNEPMDRWIQGRRDALDENIFDPTDDGCTPLGFGQPDPPTDDEEDEPVDRTFPDADDEDYAFGASTGRVLCFINTSGLNAIFWTRDGSRIGSIAVSNRNTGASMVDLLTWWRDEGRKP